MSTSGFFLFVNFYVVKVKFLFNVFFIYFVCF